MEENQNDEIVIKEDSYNPFVTKTSESLIADDESSGYNNTREKMKTTSKQQEILQEMDQTFDSNDDTTVQNYENKASDDYYDVNDIKGTKVKTLNEEFHIWKLLDKYMERILLLKMNLACIFQMQLKKE